MSWDDGISGAHREIASSGQPRIGVLAGPGTGKTSYGLMRRVARLLEQRVRGGRILLLSFTRVAAADLRDKVAALGIEGSENVRATTLHSYCLGLLQRDAVLAITGRTPRILLDHEVDLMLRDIGGVFGNIHERRKRLEAFTAGWARTLDDSRGLADSEEDREFEAGALKWLRLHKAMLIGEVVPEAYRYLVNNPAAEELNAFDHVIVDEYQDLNPLEQTLIDVLAFNAALCVAGDDDQSIYSVRYANPEGIRAYLAREDVEPFEIQTCGRCPKRVVAMANSLIRQAPGRDKPDLEARSDADDGRVAIVQWRDVDSEVDGVVSAIAADLSSTRREPGDILVLTNWRRIGERIRARLNELEIPARSFFTEEELASEDARESIALLRLVVAPGDQPAMRVLLGLGEGTGRSEAYRRLLEAARVAATSPAELLQRMGDGERAGVSVPALVDRFMRAHAKRGQLSKLQLTDLVDDLFPEGRDSTVDLRALAVDALIESMDAEDLLQAMLRGITQDDVPQNPDFVRVMSLHKSKGLTSPSVYVVGAVDGVLPTVRSDDPAKREAAYAEGRRLFYVAVTRAAEELVISCSRTMALADANARGVRYDRATIRPTAGQLTIRTIASPYIAELGPEAPRPETGINWLAGR